MKRTSLYIVLTVLHYNISFIIYILSYNLYIIYTNINLFPIASSEEYLEYI